MKTLSLAEGVVLKCRVFSACNHSFSLTSIEPSVKRIFHSFISFDYGRFLILKCPCDYLSPKYGCTLSHHRVYSTVNM